MKLIDALRRRAHDEEAEPAAGLPGGGDRATRPLPDPARVPTARGTWEQAALTNVDITELVKRQINAQTPPWKK